LAFFGDEAGFFAVLGLAAFFVAGFLVAVDFGFFATGDFLALVVVAALVVFFAGVEVDVALFFAATGLAVVALLFGLTCRGFLVALLELVLALVELADFGVELDRDLLGLAAFAVLGLAADVALLVDLTAEVELPVATFLADFGPADLDAARFLVPDADEAVLELDALFLVFLIDDEDFFTPVDSPLVPSLNEPLAPLPFVCLKCFALTPFFKAIFKC